MDLIRILLFLYIVATPLLFFILVYLSVRTRNILLDRLWLKRYLLPSFLLFVLMIVNVGLLVRFYPNVVGQIHISCVSYGDIEYDVQNVSNFQAVGLVEIKELDYVKKAHVFEPDIVGYTDHQYYEYALVQSYLRSIDDEGLLMVSENHQTFLMDDAPCALLEDGGSLSPGVYLIVSDERALPLSYQDQWYDEARTLFSYQEIEGYDLSKPLELQADSVKEQIEDLVSMLGS